MRIEIRVGFVFVLLLSLFVFSIYGANARRGIGGAIIGGIINTQKAVIHGITDTVVAAVETGKKTHNVTKTDDTVRSLDLLEDGDIANTASKISLTDGGMFSTGGEHYSDEVGGTLGDNLIASEREAFDDSIEVFPVEEGSGMVGEMFAEVANAVEEASSGEMGVMTTEERAPTFDTAFSTDFDVDVVDGPHNDFQSGSEGHLEDFEKGRYYHHSEDRHHYSDSAENDFDGNGNNFGEDNHNVEGDRDYRGNKYHHYTYSDDVGDNYSNQRYHRHGDSKWSNYDDSGRYRRSVGSAVVGGIGNTANSVATGIENTIDATVVNKTDGSSSGKAAETKASGIGGAIVGGISNTASAVSEGVKGTVDAAVVAGGNTTSKIEDKSISQKVVCKSQDICYGDSDCNGGKCVGPFVGTCNCNACFNFMTCTSDEGCGGLHGACDMNIKRCNCHEAQKKLGFPNYFDALTKFCNHQSCNATSDSCNGLPCNTGRCFC